MTAFWLYPLAVLEFGPCLLAHLYALTAKEHHTP